MATLPLKLPRWAATVYRGDEAAWDEAKTQCRTALYEWAVAREPHTYTDLTRRVTAIDWPGGAFTDEGSQIGYLLGQVVLEELSLDQDKPIISALVYGQDESMPSTGFWKFCGELGVAVGSSEQARMAFWLAELDACYRTYG